MSCRRRLDGSYFHFEIVLVVWELDVYWRRWCLAWSSRCGLEARSDGVSARGHVQAHIPKFLARKVQTCFSHSPSRLNSLETLRLLLLVQRRYNTRQLAMHIGVRAKKDSV
jgi:hypothetical protein